MNAKAGAQERFTQAQDDLIALGHRIHAHPELGFEEEKACTWIAETHCVTQAADKALIDGALSMAWTAIDMATDERIRDRLIQRKAAGTTA